MVTPTNKFLTIFRFKTTESWCLGGVDGSAPKENRVLLVLIFFLANISTVALNIYKHLFFLETIIIMKRRKSIDWSETIDESSRRGAVMLL